MSGLNRSSPDMKASILSDDGRSGSWPWVALGLEGPADRKAVRRAYAVRLKRLDQETEQAAFETLRRAYEVALVRVEQDAQGSADMEPAEQTPPSPARSPVRAAGGLRMQMDKPSPITPPKPDPEIEVAPPPEDAFGGFGTHDSATLRDAVIKDLRGDGAFPTSARLVAIATDPALIDPDVFDEVADALAHHLVTWHADGHRMPALTPDELATIEATFRWRTDPDVLPLETQCALLGARSSSLIQDMGQATIGLSQSAIAIMFTSRILTGWLVMCMILWGGAALRALFDFADPPPEWTVIRWMITALPLLVIVAAVAFALLSLLVAFLSIPFEVLGAFAWTELRRWSRQRRSVQPIAS